MSVGVTVVVLVAESIGVVVGVSLAVSVGVAVGEYVGVWGSVTVGESLGLSVGVTVGESVAVFVGVSLAVSVGVTMDLDVVYVESAAHEQGTLKRPGAGAVRGIVETAMGRAWLAQLPEVERMAFLSRMRKVRPGEYERGSEGMLESVLQYPKRGFAINLGDAGLGVRAVGVASRIRSGSRYLLFNCAVPGYRARPNDLIKTIGPSLVQLVNMADRQVGLR